MNNMQGVKYQQAYSYQASMYAKTEITESTKTEKDEAAAAAASAQEKDTVEISGAKTPENTDSTKQIYKPDMDKVNYLKSVLDKQAETLRKMAEKLVGGQSFSANGVFDAKFAEWVSGKSNGSYYAEMEFSMNFSFDFSMSMIGEVDEETRLQAEELISEDGPLGVNAVTENILGFAKAISGGDPSKAQLLKDAVQKGFDFVSNMFGGFDKLPDVTKKTYDAVMKGFDEWLNAGKEPAEEIEKPADEVAETEKVEA